MSSSGNVIVTQLVVDASGAKTGVADFEAALDRARDAANEAGTAGNSFDSALRKWTQSLAQADPVIRAQINQQQALNRQLAINKDAVALGIATQDAANAQLDKVNAKYQAYVDNAEEATTKSSAFGQATSVVTEQLTALVGVFSAAEAFHFAKDRFEDAAALNNMAQQAGESVEAFQAVRAAMVASGVGADEASSLIERLNKNIGDAKNQSGTARDALNQLGVTFQDLSDGAGSALPKIAQGLLAIPDATTRARLEVELFGKSGQALESALEVLSSSTSDLIEKEKALGLVLGSDVTTAAKEADDKLATMWARLKNDLTPSIVGAVNALLDFQQAALDLNKNGLFGGGFAQAKANFDAQKAAADAAAAQQKAADEASGKSEFGVNLNNAVLATGQNVGSAVGTTGRYTTADEDKFVAAAQMEAQLAGLSAERRAEETATIGRANAELQDGSQIITNNDGTLRKTVNSYDEARSIVGETAAKQVEQLASITYQAQQADKLKETFAGYLASLDDAVRLASESTTQHQAEADVIKAAQIYQQQNNVLAKDRAKTYGDAVAALGQERSQLVLNAAAAQQTAAFSKSISDEQFVANTALAANNDERDLAVQIAQKQLQLGRDLTDSEKDRLKAIQAANDAINLDKYIQGLKDELTLTGATADERERQAAILQAIHATHGQLTADQAKEIDGLVQVRQEMEKWQQLVSSIQGDFQNFFEDVLEHGQLNFGKLFRSIEASFAEMIANLAAQAIAQPIIVPMIEEVVGGLGLGGAAGAVGSVLGNGSAASGGLGGLGGLSNVGSLLGGGGGDILGIGSLINGVGTSLGFGTSIAAANLGSITGAGIGGSSLTSSLGTLSGTTTGGIFGTSLGGLLGGVGVGSLAGSLLFGNKNDAGLGSMGGAAAGALLGSIVPGIGTLIGGLIGGVLGGGLGSLTGSDNHGAWVDLLNGGSSYALTQQGSSQNTQQVQQVAQSINQAVQSLQAAGVSVTNNIKSLEIGSSKDVLELANGQKINSKGNDPDGLLNAAMQQLLSTASSTDADIQKIIQTYQGQGGINSSNLDQFLSDIGFAQGLQSLDFSDSTKQLSQVQQALQSITQQFDDAITRAQQLGLDTSKIEDARQAALDSVAQGFNDTTEAALKQITDPVGAAYDSLIAAQQQNLSDAKDISGDVAMVQQLNDVQLTQFLEGLTEDQRQALAATENLTGTVAYNLAEGFTGLSSSIEDLVDQANDAANAATAAADTWGNASDALNQASKALLISDQSLSPGDAYKNAETQFGQLKDAALGGDANSANQLASFASQFLQASFNYNASSTQYASDLAMVQATLAQVAQFSTSQQTLAQQQADAAKAAIPLLQSIDTSIKNQTNATQSGLNALSAQVAALAKQVQQSNTQQRMGGG